MLKKSLKKHIIYFSRAEYLIKQHKKWGNPRIKILPNITDMGYGKLGNANERLNIQNKYRN